MGDKNRSGMGYKTPTLFTEETETIQYRNVLQLNNVKSEKSYGVLQM
jgi:iron complex outermembrane receptor protein/outer membrane receptor for ferrienterochelin and colicins